MKRILKFLFLILWIIFTFVVTWLAIIRIGGNFHQIAPGVYRSAQFYEYNFKKFYQKCHFKTILNLRGKKEDKNWYQYEIKFCKEHNITHIDFAMNDKEKQSIKKMNKIISIIKNSKKPIVIHCRSGADRTGLASALYLYSLGDKKNNMLSLKYGHFPYLGSPTKAMDTSYENYIKNN